MPNGWWCDQCKEYFSHNVIQTKITIALEPRPYDAAVTLCSLVCLENFFPRLTDDEAWSSEHRRPRSRLRRLMIEREVD